MGGGGRGGGELLQAAGDESGQEPINSSGSGAGHVCYMLRRGWSRA